MDLEEVAIRYDALAAELDSAAAHARRAASHFRSRELARGPAHAFSVYGHLRNAMDKLDVLARLHADRSEP